MASVYRFKIKNLELNDEMVSFSLYHLHETNEDLKESFQKWCQEEHIQSLILQEKKYLELLQYDLVKNPIETKIFKSIKYYHMKKKPKECVERETKHKHVFIYSKTFLELVKSHISQYYSRYSPSLAYNDFVSTYQKIIEDESKNVENFQEKLKKMYKNQFYQFKKNEC